MFTLPSVNAPAAFDWFCLPCFLKSFASSFQTFPRLVKVFVVDNTYGIFAILKTCLASSFCLRNLLSKLTFNPSWNFCPGVLVLVFPDVIFNTNEHRCTLIGLLQQTITRYKLRHAGGQAHYYSRSGTFRPRPR